MPRSPVGLLKSLVHAIGGESGGDAPLPRLPGLEFPPQHEANSQAPERHHFRLFAGVFAKVFGDVVRSPRRRVQSVNSLSILCCAVSMFCIHVAILKDVFVFYFVR